MLLSLSPTAAQVGATTEHTVFARYNLFGAYRVVVEGEGVTGEIVPPEVKPVEAKPSEEPPKPNVESLKIRFTVAADAQPGVRDFRLATPQGASTLGQLVVVRDPLVVEQPANDAPPQAQAISLPATVCGAVEKSEDVDYFKFAAAAGESWTFHVQALRLQNKIHDLQNHVDPILTIRSANGSTLAASDNHFSGDPFLCQRFEQAGEYLLEIRDVRYKGEPHWQYSIEISRRPFVTNVFPLGVERGKEAKLELIGFNLPEAKQIAWQAPGGIVRSQAWWQLPLAGEASNPAPVVVSDLPQVVEAAGENQAPAGAQLVTAPVGISGRIEATSDIDCFAFEAKKGDSFNIEVIAQRMQAALDPHLRVLDEQGKELALNDDMQIGRRSYPDACLPHWTAPADGRFTIELRDLHLRGGAEFVYFIKLTPSQPRFSLFVDADKTQLSPGMSGVIFVRSVREAGFRGAIQLGIEGLPPGVTAECGAIAEAIDKDGNLALFANAGGPARDGCIVLQAAKDASLSLANVKIFGSYNVPLDETTSTSTIVRAAVYQEIYLPGGGRGHWPAEVHAVCVGAPGDLRSVSLNATEITLQPGQSQQIDVTIERSPAYNQNVTLDAIYTHLSQNFGDTLPRGVTVDAAASQTLLDGKTNQGRIVLKAAADAPPCTRQLVPVMAHVSINFVMKSTYAAGPLRISVEPALTK